MGDFSAVPVSRQRLGRKNLRSGTALCMLNIILNSINIEETWFPTPGNLATMVPKDFRPMALRPALSNGLPLNWLTRAELWWSQSA